MENKTSKDHIRSYQELLSCIKASGISMRPKIAHFWILKQAMSIGIKFKSNAKYKWSRLTQTGDRLWRKPSKPLCSNPCRRRPTLPYLPLEKNSLPICAHLTHPAPLQH